MAKKSKNKQTNHAQQKVEAAHHKKEYFKRFKNVCDLIHPDLYSVFVPIQLEALYHLRGMSVKIVPDGKVSKKVMAFANEFAQLAQKEPSIPLYKDGPKIINLREYHQIIMPIDVLLNPKNKDDDMYYNLVTLEDSPWFEQYMEAYEDREDAYYTAMDKLRASIRIFMSDLRYMVFYVNTSYNTDSSKHSDSRIRPEISIHPFRPERKKIKIANGEFRNAIRYVIVSSDTDEPESRMFIPVSIPASFLGFKTYGEEIMMPLYITEHALNRLDERTDDTRLKGYIQLSILTSFTENNNKPKLIKLRDNKMMMEYKLLDFKIGYLVISVLEGIILVRTFLLMTSPATPEGKILHEQLGLQKLDNKYLGIDVLHTFLNSDILENEDICEMFIKAGCQSLIDLCKNLKISSQLEKNNDEKIKLAAQMRDYLTKGNPEEWEESE
jgi:hypothetical protein